jgi:hypothetical protein
LPEEEKWPGEDEAVQRAWRRYHYEKPAGVMDKFSFESLFKDFRRRFLERKLDPMLLEDMLTAIDKKELTLEEARSWLEAELGKMRRTEELAEEGEAAFRESLEKDLQMLKEMSNKAYESLLKARGLVEVKDLERYERMRAERRRDLAKIKEFESAIQSLKDRLHRKEIEVEKYREEMGKLRAELDKARLEAAERPTVPPPEVKPAPLPAPAPTPAVPTPPLPKVVTLPPVPETCPIDGTPLSLVERVPILLRDPLRLTAEEAYWRAKMGFPLPTAKLEFFEVPATMRIWMCGAPEPHYFERDERGRLVEVSAEALYRKILRERARIQRVIYPAYPAYYPPYPAIVPRAELSTREAFKLFLETEKKMTVTDYMGLSELEKKRINEEFADWYVKHG